MEQTSNSETRPQDEKYYSIDPRNGKGRQVAAVYFDRFQTMAGSVLSAPTRKWVETANLRLEQGMPVKTLVHMPDRQLRLRIFECAPLAPAVPEESLHAALAYLFKADPVPEWGNLDSVPGKPVLFLPNGDIFRSWGLLIQEEHGIFFLFFESRNPIDGAMLGKLPDFEIAPSTPRKPSVGQPASDIFQAHLQNTLGLKAVEDSLWAPALLHFQKALDLDTTHPPFLINAAAIYQSRKEIPAGIKLLSEYPHLLSVSSELAGIFGSMHEGVGNYAEAKKWAKIALEGDPENVEWLINLSDALWGLGERVHSKNVLLKPYNHRQSFRLSVYLASTYLGLEEYESAREVLMRAHRDTVPSSKSAEYNLRALVGLKDYEGAIDFFNDLDSNARRNADGYFLKAMCEFNLNLYRLASLSLKKALELDPTLREAQQLAGQIAALVGIKSNIILKEPISPLKVPTSMKAAHALLRVPRYRDLPNRHPIILLSRTSAFHWQKARRWKKSRHHIYYISNPAKLIQHSELTLELNPNYSKFYVNYFKVYDANLKLIETKNINDYYVTKTHNTTLHPENLLVHLPIKAKSGKLFLEVLTTEESQAPSNEFPYLRYANKEGFPVLEENFLILHPPQNLVIHTFGNTKVDTLTDKLSFHLIEEMGSQEDKFSPAIDEFGSGFAIAAHSTWQDVGRNYQKLLSKHGTDPDSLPLAVRERAQEIVESNRGENPTQVLFRFVRDSIRYNNYQFSLHGLVPEKSATVLAKGYGDCKGHALLLTQLLKATGIDAKLCLVSLNHTGDPNQPTLHQFNHMITYVPAKGKREALFLDATEKFQAFRASPLALEGKTVLILDSGNPFIALVPEQSIPSEHMVEVYHILKVGKSKSAHGKDSLVLTGKIASEFRARLSGWNKSTKNQNLVSWLASSYSHFIDDDFNILNEQEADKPLIMVFSYKQNLNLDGRFKEFVHFPKLELSFLRYPKAVGRLTPIYFPHEVAIRSEWLYEVPSGYRWTSLSLDRELSESNLNWLFSIDQSSPDKVRIQQSWNLNPFVASPDEYAKIQDSWDVLLAQGGLKLSISRQ